MLLWWNIVLNLTLLYYCFGDDFLSKFVQSDYKIKDLRGNVDYYDTNYVREIKMRTFKYNRTTAAFNISCVLKIDVEDKLEVLVQSYKFLSNEFRPVAVRYQVSATKAFKANIVGIQKGFRKCGFCNNTYWIKDVNYTICNFVVDESKFPPLIPTGIYKNQLTFIYLNKNLIILNTYGEVYHQIYIPEDKLQH